MRFVLFAMMMLFTVSAQAAPLKVVATISIIGDLVKQVGNDDVEVTTLVGPDSDAHVFQPSPADGKTIANASIVFENGLGLEGWMERLMASTDYKGKVVVVSDGIGKTLTMDMGEDNKEVKPMIDPHAWQNIANGRKYVRNIANALSAADPAHAMNYMRRADALDKELSTLDRWVKSEIAKVPAGKRKVISSHDAFGYFANAYGVEFLAPVGVSTEAEPSAKGMSKLIEQIKQHGARAIFFENMANAKLVQQLAAEAGVTVGPALYADALSPAGGVAPNYQAMF
ncbi:MAG: zinc ABC transporter substrate-binding protein, partial [Alphaproteobacteria bacterium]|nr:zinc ABC transporter substrate-binding protein [Alphaproteobacteria bacterium]